VFSIAGGSAAPAVCSAEEGDEIVKVALDRFGAVHVLIANAGILRDKSFMGMNEKDWDQVIAVHLRYDPPFHLLSCLLKPAQGHL
jgi:multifunctional beta-oxidation protein